MTMSGLPDNFEMTRPRVTLLVQTARRYWMPVTFIADSGNDLTLITVSTARALGINHDCMQNNSIRVAGIGGITAKYCVHQVLMRIGSSRPFPVTLAVGELRENLLGRHGIFDKFRVTFESNRVMFQSLSATGRCCGII